MNMQNPFAQQGGGMGGGGVVIPVDSQGFWGWATLYTQGPYATNPFFGNNNANGRAPINPIQTYPVFSGWSPNSISGAGQMFGGFGVIGQPENPSVTFPGWQTFNPNQMILGNSSGIYQPTGAGNNPYVTGNPWSLSGYPSVIGGGYPSTGWGFSGFPGVNVTGQYQNGFAGGFPNGNQWGNAWTGQQGGLGQFMGRPVSQNFSPFGMMGF